MTYRSELWSPEDYMKGYDENRVEGKLKRFIDAYYLPPTKRFYSEYDEIKGKDGELKSTVMKVSVMSTGI